MMISRRTFMVTVGVGAAGLGRMETAPAALAAEPKGASSVRFGVLADVQYCDAEPMGNRHYRTAAGKLEECVGDLGGRDLDFVVQLGDLIDRDFRSFDTVLPVFDGLQTPLYHVLGNHDFAVAEPRKREVPARLGMASRFYEFSARGWRFIVLDGNDISVIASEEDTAERREAEKMLGALASTDASNAHTWNGGIGENQLAWLDRRLSGARAAGERAVIFCHFPVFPPDAHNLWNDGEVLEVIDGHTNVVAFMNGHNHGGNRGKRRGVHYITLEAMVETPDENAYAMAIGGSTQLTMTGFGRVQSVLPPSPKHS